MLNIEKYLTKHSNAGIINVVKIKFMRVCWNWQTGTFEGRVFYDVRVQVPSLAPVIKAVPKRYSLFSCMAVKEKVQLGYHIR